MGYLILKFFVSAAVIVAVSEIAKRYSFAAALLASLPLTSILAFIWLYMDTKDTVKIAALAHDIAWLVLPSMVLFIVLPIMLKQGINFWLSLTISCIATAVAYGFVKLTLLHIR